MSEPVYWPRKPEHLDAPAAASDAVAPADPAAAETAPGDAAAPVPAAPAPAPSAAVPAAQTSSNGVIAFVLALASWILLPLVLAIVALVFAKKADDEVAASGGRIQAGGLVTAAKIIAWINIAVAAAGLLLLVIFGTILLLAGGFGS